MICQGDGLGSWQSRKELVGNWTAELAITQNPIPFYLVQPNPFPFILSGKSSKAQVVVQDEVLQDIDFRRRSKIFKLLVITHLGLARTRITLYLVA